MATMSDTITYVSFKLNQSQIIKFCCFHNAELDESCYGECYLKKKLEEQNTNNPSNQQKFPVPISKQLIEEIVPLELLPELFSDKTSILSFSYLIFQEACNSQDFIRKIIDPPET